MKKTLFLGLAVLILSMAAVSCSEPAEDLFEGSWKHPTSPNTVVIFTDSKFESKMATNTVSSGTFSFTNKKITFSLTKMYEGGADFALVNKDPPVIITGDYKFNKDNKSFTISNCSPASYLMNGTYIKN